MYIVHAHAKYKVKNKSKNNINRMIKSSNLIFIQYSVINKYKINVASSDFALMRASLSVSASHTVMVVNDL